LEQAGELEGLGGWVKFEKIERMISMIPGFRRNGVSHDDSFCCVLTEFWAGRGEWPPIFVFHLIPSKYVSPLLELCLRNTRSKYPERSKCKSQGPSNLFLSRSLIIK
jgi:hypothetical protein